MSQDSYMHLSKQALETIQALSKVKSAFYESERDKAIKEQPTNPKQTNHQIITVNLSQDKEQNQEQSQKSQSNGNSLETSPFKNIENLKNEKKKVNRARIEFLYKERVQKQKREEVCKIEEDLKECSFKPKISQCAQQTQGTMKQREKIWKKKKSQKLEQIMIIQEEQAQRNCTFEPKKKVIQSFNNKDVYERNMKWLENKQSKSLTAQKQNKKNKVTGLSQERNMKTDRKNNIQKAQELSDEIYELLTNKKKESQQLVNKSVSVFDIGWSQVERVEFKYQELMEIFERVQNMIN